MSGKENLEKYTNETFKRTITKVNDRIYHFFSIGHSSPIAIIADNSVILIDATESPDALEEIMLEIAKITEKPIKTLIYTHGHPDHRGGSGALRGIVDDIIAFAPADKQMRFYDEINDVLFQRGIRQFGSKLTNDEAISQGIGLRELYTQGKRPYDILPPTTVFDKEIVETVIDGVPLVMKRVGGEAPDEIFVWLPEDRVMCCADNYYACWPNLYAILGTQYRDISIWVDALTEILSYEPDVLLPGHTQPLIGKELIQEQVGTYRDAIDWVLHETLACANAGLSLDEAAEHVRLPEELRSKSYLQEFYGTVEWSVRSIYVGYLGWFDGRPEALYPAPRSKMRACLLELVGIDNLIAKIDELIEAGENQLALELMSIAEDNTDIRERKIAALRARADEVDSANGRHYLISCARDLETEANR